MRTRGIFGSTIVAAMVMGCSGLPQTGDEGEVGEIDSAFKLRCPDPQTDCSMTNGTGVYTDEDGYAGMGPSQILITYFTNSSNGVGFAGDFVDNGGSKYSPMAPGNVYTADYAGVTGYKVLAVSEKNTEPVWTLGDPYTGANPFTVVGAQLLRLQLHLFLSQSLLGPKSFTVSFTKGGVDTTGKNPIMHFNMVWRGDGTSTDYQYCINSASLPDQVVFQQGFAVDPVNAKVTRDSTTTGFVTLSCTLGAMAKVHQWGYPYRLGTATYFFDSGLQMKRDSYCANAAHYTKSGTPILIDDSYPFNDDAIQNIEAFWSPEGAICVNMMYRRYNSMAFSGFCNGQPLPDCSLYPQVKPYLADGALSQQP
jgi:hypothetical protein